MNRTGELDREPANLEDRAVERPVTPWRRRPDCRINVGGNGTGERWGGSTLPGVAGREAEGEAVGRLAGCT